MGRLRTAAAIAAVVCAAGCSQASSDEPPAKRPTTTTPAAESVTPHGVRVEAGRDATTVIAKDGGRVRLAGRFEFDAVSTNGSLLYLIEHRPPEGSENYRVRVYDFGAGELRREPVADKRTLETDMTGRPKARATSADSVWVFTLYRGATHAFVHALNVEEAYALCLDLPHGSGTGSGTWELTVTKDGATLHAVAGSARDSADFDLREVLR